jgi:hypothetical protein
MSLQVADGFFCDKGGRVELLRHRGPPRLRRDQAGRRQRIAPAAQAVGVRGARFQPAGVVPVHLVAVPVGKAHEVEAVIRARHRPVRVLHPQLADLDLVGRTRPASTVGLAQFARRQRKAGLRFDAVRHRMAGHVLKMRLADQRGAIAGVPQKVDERHRVEIERNAIVPRAVHGRHASGHQHDAVRHADRAGDVEILEPQAVGGDAVDVRRPHDRVAVATKVIHAVLVGDEEEKVRLCRHRSILVSALDNDPSTSVRPGLVPGIHDFLLAT